MNLETINKWLDEEYGCSYTRLEELHDFYFEKYWALQQENKQLKMINKEYERLNKESGRNFKITNVQEYDIHELLSYKNYKENWNKLKKDIGYELLKLREPNEYNDGLFNAFTYINNKMQELEGSDNDV